MNYKKVSIKDMSSFFDVSERTANRMKRTALDILGKDVKRLTVVDFCRIFDVRSSDLYEQLPHLQPTQTAKMRQNAPQYANMRHAM